MTYLIKHFGSDPVHPIETFTVDDDILQGEQDEQRGAVYQACKKLSLTAEPGTFFIVYDNQFPDEPICLVMKLYSTVWGEPHYK